MLVGAVSHGIASSTAITVDTGEGWAILGEQEDNLNYQAHNAEYIVQTSAAAQDADWTLGSSGLWGAVIAAFKAASGASPQTITVDPAALTATPIKIADVIAPISRKLDPAAATATGIKAKINRTVKPKTATLTIALPKADAVPGTKSIVLDPAAATATPIRLADVVPGAVSKLQDTAALTATAIKPKLNQVTKLDPAAATATGIGADIVPGAKATILDAPTATATGIAASIATAGAPQTITLDTATATATGIAFTVVDDDEEFVKSVGWGRPARPACRVPARMV